MIDEPREYSPASYQATESPTKSGRELKLRKPTKGRKSTGHARRHGTSPKRTIAAAQRLSESERSALARKLAYVGSAIHKTKPGDYGFRPPVNPRPWKSICDGQRIVLLAEAKELFARGIALGMFSDFPQDGVPKYIWSVDAQGDVYEAKVSPGTSTYKGYRLEEEDSMRVRVAAEWKRRCLES